MEQPLPNKMTPALIAGASFGFASGIPIVGCANMACCALAIGGGLFASFLWLRNATPSSQPPYGDSVVLGLLTGAVGAVVSAMVSLPFTLMGAAGGFGSFSQIQDMMGDQDLPPEVANALESLGGVGIGIGSIVLGLIFALILYPIFAMIGALIGTALFHKKSTPAYSPPPTQPAPPPPPPATL
jgi:hypothetical protein